MLATAAMPVNACTTPSEADRSRRDRRMTAAIIPPMAMPPKHGRQHRGEGFGGRDDKLQHQAKPHHLKSKRRETGHGDHEPQRSQTADLRLLINSRSANC